MFGVVQIQNISTGKTVGSRKKRQPQRCFQHPVQCKLNKE